VRVCERTDVHDVVAQICRHMDVANGSLQERKKERRKEKRNERKKEKRKAPDSSGCARTEF